MKTVGRVVKTKGAMAKIKTERPQSCSSCPSSAICNTREITQWVLSNGIAAEGDFVLVENDNESRSLLLVCYIFLTPIAIFFFSYFLYTLNPFLAFAAVPLLAAFFFSLSALNKRFKQTARIVKTLTDSEKTEICTKE